MLVAVRSVTTGVPGALGNAAGMSEKQIYSLRRSVRALISARTRFRASHLLYIFSV